MVQKTLLQEFQNGNSVIIRFPDTLKKIETKLSVTSRFIDPTNRTFQVACKIQSGEVQLRANMIAYVKIKDYTNEKAYCIPVNLCPDQVKTGNSFCAIQKDNKWNCYPRDCQNKG